MRSLRAVSPPVYAHAPGRRSRAFAPVHRRFGVATLQCRCAQPGYAARRLHAVRAPAGTPRRARKPEGGALTMRMCARRPCTRVRRPHPSPLSRPGAHHQQTRGRWRGRSCRCAHVCMLSVSVHVGPSTASRVHLPLPGTYRTLSPWINESTACLTSQAICASDPGTPHNRQPCAGRWWRYPRVQTGD